MSRTRRIEPRTLLCGGVAACVAAAVLAASAPVGAAATVGAAGTAAGHDCAALDDLTSVQVSYVTSGGPGVGESATFTDNILKSSGVIDTADALAGKVTTITGTGLTGAYLGMTGTVSNEKITDTTDTVDIDLCRQGRTP